MALTGEVTLTQHFLFFLSIVFMLLAVTHLWLSRKSKDTEHKDLGIVWTIISIATLAAAICWKGNHEGAAVFLIIDAISFFRLWRLITRKVPPASVLKFKIAPAGLCLGPDEQ